MEATMEAYKTVSHERYTILIIFLATITISWICHQLEEMTQLTALYDEIPLSLARQNVRMALIMMETVLVTVKIHHVMASLFVSNVEMEGLKQMKNVMMEIVQI